MASAENGALFRDPHTDERTAIQLDGAVLSLK